MKSGRQKRVISRECIVSTKATKALRLLLMLPLKGKTRLANASTLFERESAWMSFLCSAPAYPCREKLSTPL